MNLPVENTPNEDVPEDVEKLQEKNRYEDLQLHPPRHENALSRRETTRRLSIRRAESGRQNEIM